MEEIKHSFVLPTFFNQSIKEEDYFEKVLKISQSYSIDKIEYYSLDIHPHKVQEMISEGGCEGIYLAAVCQKQEGLNPSSINKREERRAVDQLKKCIEYAVEAGSQSVLINSGEKPIDEKDEQKALDVLFESVCSLCDYSDGEIEITLEPGDRDVEYRHLIGGTNMAIDFVNNVREIYPNFSITLDTSHLAQLEEDVKAAIKTAKPYCHHIHLANCVLEKESVLYGDKHPGFNVENGIYSFEDIYQIYKYLIDEYKGSRLTIGVEIIINEIMLFSELTSKMEWFFKNSNKMLI